MLKFPCLVLDHDDTVVQSETTVNYPYFCYILDVFRPGATITLEQYIRGCCELGFADMCRQWYHFTEQELIDEYNGWKDYIRSHTPPPYPGIADIIRRQKEAGGLVCVVSHSSEEIITRDYITHFGFAPDDIYGWDMPQEQRKPNPYPISQIMAKHGLESSQLLVVDDMLPGAQMARKAGISIAFAGWSKENVPHIAKEMEEICDFAFYTPKKLEEFLFD